jgi:hypothetical protein
MAAVMHTVIQKYMRAHLGRADYYRLKYQPRKAEEKLHIRALRIQRLYRGWKGRKVRYLHSCVCWGLLLSV